MCLLTSSMLHPQLLVATFVSFDVTVSALFRALCCYCESSININVTLAIQPHVATSRISSLRSSTRTPPLFTCASDFVRSSYTYMYRLSSNAPKSGSKTLSV
jgi:hypothetical protein